MSLVPGSRLGLYEIIAPIGEGGMGVVYRARDTKLNRDVALKLLNDVVVGDRDRLARFHREAQVLASLNHPNIAHLYGFEEADGVPALVMELVDGPTLADLLAGRPGSIGFEDAVQIARQIADALEAAHDQGIIHRDLKPANVKVRGDGTVKVLDFGLAKALDEHPPGSPAGRTDSPTLTGRATQLGMILGTAAYMAPEQARGRPVDRRADIWAFGVVLYEMLSGTRAFDGEDISITLASVLKEDVNWQALPADLPTPLRRLLRRCLEKDPKRRLSAIGDARLELDEALLPADRDGAITPVAVPTMPAATVSGWRRALPWVAAAAGVGLGIAFFLMWAPWRVEPALTPRRVLAALGADGSLPPDVGGTLALSSDGTMMAFVAQTPNSQSRLFVRKLEELQAIELPGTEGAQSPFFAPRGDWIGYFAGGQLRKVSTTGGASIPLCPAPEGRGGAWAEDDTIIFSPSGSPKTALLRVSAAGGAPATFVGLSEGAMSQRWPQALPNGKGILFTEGALPTGWDSANLVIAPLSGGTPKVVKRGGYFGRYVSSELASPTRALRDGGHLLYMQQGTMFAVPFDLDRLEAVGEAMPAIERVQAALFSTGGLQLAVSSEGTIVYAPGTTQSAPLNPINWMTRDGKTSVLRAMTADWTNPRFSPDGQRLAFELFDGKQRDIWVYEWVRDTMMQLTFDPAFERNPVWTPDGRRIVFASDRAKAGTSNLYWRNADGTGEVTRLTDSPESQIPASWHPLSTALAFQQNRSATGPDVMILPFDGDATRGGKPGTPTVLLGTPAVETSPMFSPDGRWIAYSSNESVGGSFDVYVRPFSGPGGPWRVSAPGQGGAYPRWTERELLFTSQGKVLFAPYTVVGESFRADKPQVWSPTGFVSVRQTNPFDIHPDGKRLAIIAAREQTEVVLDRVVFVFNFLDHLREIAPRQR